MTQFGLKMYTIEKQLTHWQKGTPPQLMLPTNISLVNCSQLYDKKIVPFISPESNDF